MAPLCLVLILLCVAACSSWLPPQRLATSLHASSSASITPDESITPRVVRRRNATSKAGTLTRPTRAASFDVLVGSLRAFHSAHGHLKVPRNFVITKEVQSSPGQISYPPYSLGMRLGVRLNSVRSSMREKRQIKEGKVAALESIPGFSWRPHEDRQDLFVAAVRAYSMHKGNPSSMSKDFIVEEGDADFPQETWDMKLGVKVHNFLYRGDFANLSDTLAELSLQPVKDGFDKRHYEFIYAALQTYQKLYNSLKVPFDFVVPSSPDWEQTLWGLKLGYRVANIRYRGDFVLQDKRLYDELDALGFVWKKGGFS